MADKTLTCKDCGAEFVFTEGEQAFYAEKGFENDPVRCPECRKQENNKEEIISSKHKKSGFATLFFSPIWVSEWNEEISKAIAIIAYKKIPRNFLGIFI